MADQIHLQNKEYLRISLKSYSQIEYSNSAGKAWMTHFRGSYQIGEFLDLLKVDRLLLAVTTKGIFYTRNEGLKWEKRFSGNAMTGTMEKLTYEDGVIVLQAENGTFYSTDDGRSWGKNPR